MRLLVLLLVTGSAFAHSALVDDSGAILDVGVTAGPAKSGASWVTIPKYDADLCDTLYDEYGRCRWQVDLGGNFVKLATPRFASKSAPSETRKTRAAVDRLERSLQRVMLLERWQATPALVEIQDRQADLDTANADVKKITDILAER